MVNKVKQYNNNNNNKKMKDDIRNSCGKRRGCYVTILTKDSDIRVINSKSDNVHRPLHGKRNDIQKMVFISHLSLDKNIQTERQMEEKIS